MGNCGTTIDDVVPSLADGVVRHAVALVMLLPKMELAYEESSHVALFRHDDRVFDFVWGCCISESAANSKEAFIDKWVQLVEVAVEFDTAVPLPRTLAILELVIVTFEPFESPDILLKVVELD